MSTIAQAVRDQSKDWSAKWCFPVALTHPWNTYAYFRRVIELPQEPRRVLARVSADARYTLYVNGQRVHQGPARSFPGRQSFDALDLTPLFNAGTNVIAAVVHQFGAPTFFSVFRDASGFLFDGVAEFEDSSIPLHTPTGWQCRLAQGWRKSTTRMSIQLGFQEHFDADVDEPDWMLATFAPKADSAWKEPWVAGPVGTHPWLLMEARGVPLLADHIESFDIVAAQFTGENPRGYKVTEDVYHLVNPAECKKATDSIQNASAMLADNAECAVIEPPEEGHFVAVTLSLATYRTGHLVLEIDDAAGDEIIDVLYSEEIEKSKLPLLVPLGHGCQESTATRYRCRPGAQRWESFHYIGMRHVLVVFRNVENKPLKIRRIAVRQVHTTVENVGEFTCSDEYLNRIWEIGRNTQLNCSFDAYVDCPWREQAMWWGDSRVQAMVSSYVFGDISLLERGIRLIAQSQTPDGALHAHAPADIPRHRLPDFMMTWVGTLWDHYWHTGRTDLVAECIVVMHRLFEFLAAHESDEGLIGSFDGYWMFLDWQDVFKGDYSAPFNLMYLQSLRWASELCALAGDASAVARYNGSAARVQVAVENRFFNEKTGRWRDGYDAQTGKPIEQMSQHTHTLAIVLGLKSDTHPAIAREVLLKGAESKRTKILTASPFFYAYVLQAMAQCGLNIEVVSIIGDKWGEFVDAGASTFPELWDVKYESRCHAWSASPVYLLMQIVLGVKQTAPGWASVEITPTPAILEFARGVVPTPRGLIRVEWEKAGEDQLVVRIDLPPGIKGTFRSPSGEDRELDTGGNEFHT